MDLKYFYSCRYQKRMSNIIDDVLEWSPRLALSGMMEKQQTVVNATDSPKNFSDGSTESPEKVVPPDVAEAETFPEHHESEEEIGSVDGEAQQQHNDHI